jgi:hypothetical protein
MLNLIINKLPITNKENWQLTDYKDIDDCPRLDEYFWSYTLRKLVHGRANPHNVELAEGIAIIYEMKDYSGFDDDKIYYLTYEKRTV